MSWEITIALLVFVIWIKGRFDWRTPKGQGGYPLNDNVREGWIKHPMTFLPVHEQPDQTGSLEARP
jgi:hypothetical protein